MQTSTAIETFISLLKEGKRVIHTAEGYSMFPTLRPGDKILVKPLTEKIIPEPGSVIVALKNNVLILHRLIQIRTPETGITELLTQGDSLENPDMPWTRDQIIGVAESFSRNGKDKTISRISLNETRRKLNRLRLRIRVKLRIV